LSNRPFLSVVVLLVASFGVFATAHAEDATAEQLLAQGVRLHLDGNNAAAKDVLQRIDPVQLTKEQQVTLLTTLQTIDRGDNPAPVAPAPPAPPATEEPAAPATPAEPAAPAEPVAPAPAKVATPAELLLAADKQRDAGNYDGAMSLLSQAAGHPDASAEDKAYVTSRAAEITRLRNIKLTAARQTIDQVAADLGKPGADLDGAETRLKSVKSSGLNLGFFDNRRLDRLMATVGERRAELGVTPVVAEPDAPAAPLAPPVAPVAAKDPIAPAPIAAQVPAPAPANDSFVLARKLLVDEKIVEGKQAEASGAYRVAAKHYSDALTIDPTNVEAKALLVAAQAKVNSGIAAPISPIGSAIGDIEIERQATIAEYQELMAKAETLRAGRNYTSAQEAVQQAKVAIDRKKSVLGTNTYTELRTNADKLYSAITAESAIESAGRSKVQEEQDAKDAKIRTLTAERERHLQVQRLLQRAMELRKTQDYDRSLQLISQALFLDPQNPAAESMKMMIEDTQIAVKSREYMRIRNLRFAKHSMEMIEATVPYNELITYPSDWPQLTAMRLQALGNEGGESEVNRRVSLKLQDPIPVTFEGNKLVNVMDYFRNTTGVNFFVNWAALESAGVEQDMAITLLLNNVPAEQALRLVLQQAGAGAELEPIGFSIIDGIVTVSTLRDLQKTTDTRVYDIRDLLVQVPNFTGAPEFDLNSALANTSSGGSSGGAQSATTLFDDADAQGEQPTRDELVEQITTLIQDTIGKQSDWAAYGGEVSSLRELNGNLIIKSTPDNHRDIVRLLGQLRAARAMQIHIEARFLLVETNFLDELGVDLDFQYRATEGRFLGPITVAQDSAGLAGRTDSGFPGNFGAPTGVPGAFNGGGAGTGFTSTGRAMEFNIGVTFMDDLDVNLIVTATQGSRRSISLTAPRLTLFNGQRSHIMVARQVAFISDLEPVSGGVGFDPTLSVTQSGVVLDVEATVSADKRYVTMTARPSLATLVQPIRSIPQVGAANLGNDGGVGGDTTQVLSGFIEAPELELTSIRTSVSVPDKGTLLMGGQRLVADIEVEAGVPILSKIPVLNRFFTNTSKVKDERTLLILIKPTIILQEEQEEALWPGLNQDPVGFNAARSFSPGGVNEITSATP